MDSLQKETAPELQTPEAVIISTSFDKTDYTENGCGGKEKKSISEYALEYRKLGMRPIPCGKNKRPVVGKGWQNTNYSLDQISAVFANAEALGVILGDASGGIVDVDLDRREAVILANFFLPKTASFDRGVEHSGHRIYKCPGFGSRKSYSMKPKLLPDGSRKAGEKATLIELRADKCQTLFPPTRHADGTVCEWRDSIEFTSISKANLVRRVDLIAAVAHLSFYYKEGVRNNLCLSLAGYLLNEAKQPLKEAENFFKALVAVTNDDDLDGRLNTLRATAAKIENGETKILGSGGLREIIGNPLTDKLGDWLRVPGTAGAQNGGSAKITQVQQLIEIIKEQVELFQSDEGVDFASYTLNGRRLLVEVRSNDFKKYVTSQFYTKHGFPASRASIDHVIDHTASMAYLYEKRVTPEIRIAEQDGKVYVDIADKDGNVVVLSRQGWELIKTTECPIHFLRPGGMLPLPIPLPSGQGDFHLIFNHTNLQTDEQKILFTGSVLNAYCPRAPHFVTSFSGPAGSGKTTLVKMLRRLVDPHNPETCRPTQKPGELAIVASKSRILSIDNISKISPAMSDDICRIATGEGVAVRSLYTNDEVFNLSVCRPVILNAIDPPIERGDLSSRSINLILKSTPTGKSGYLPPGILLENLESDAPAIFSGLLDALVKSVAGLNSTERSDSRMANIINWITPAEEVLGWRRGTFAKVQAETQHGAMVTMLQNDPALSGVFEMTTELGKANQYFCGGYRQLLAQLTIRDTYYTSSRDFGMSFGRKLNQFQHALRSVFVTLQRAPTSRKEPARIILITDELKKKYPDWERTMESDRKRVPISERWTGIINLGEPPGDLGKPLKDLPPAVLALVKEQTK